MTRHKWTAWQKGRIVDDGVIDASSERDGIRDLLGSREWKGNDWRLRVGAASITFDAEDVAKLAGEVGDDHAADTALPGEPVPKEVVQGAIDAVIKNKVRPEKKLGELGGKSFSDSYITGSIDVLDQITPAQTARDAARRMLDERYGWSDPRSDPASDFADVVHTIRHMPNPLYPLRNGGPWQPNQVLAGVDTPCCGAGVVVSVDVVEPLKSRPHVQCPRCHERYELQVTGVLAGLPDLQVQGVFHPDVRPASTVITQAFARLGLPAGAAVYALRKMSVPPENVLQVRTSGGEVFVEFVKRGRPDGPSTVCHFTHTELEAAW